MDENIQRILQDAMTPTVAAELAHVDRATVYRWINAGLLPVYQDAANRTVVMRSDLERTLQIKAVRVAMAAEEAQRTLAKLHEHEVVDPHRRHHRKG